VTLDELPGYLRMLAVRAGYAAIPGADAMAWSTGTKLSGNSPGSPTHGGRSRLPRLVPRLRWKAGRLAGSVTMVPASTPVVATSSVSPHTIYDAVQEYGHTMHAHRDFMRYYYGGQRFSRTVTVPPRPYMRPAVDIVVSNGSCAAAAASAFYGAMWG